MIACETAVVGQGERGTGSHPTVPQQDVMRVRHTRTAGDLMADMQTSYVAWEGRVLDPSCHLYSLTCGGKAVPLIYGSAKAQEHSCPIRFIFHNRFQRQADLVAWFAAPYFVPIGHVLSALVMQVGDGGWTRLSEFGPNQSLTSFLWQNSD